MTNWNQFAFASPELAQFIQSRFTKRIAYLATIRADGCPRLHPVVVHFAEGEVFVYMNPTSPKAHDLQRDPRYALHCAVEDTSGGNGEASISGQACVVTDSAVRTKVFDGARANGFDPKDEYVLFNLTIERATSITYADEQVKRQTWSSVGTSSARGGV